MASYEVSSSQSSAGPSSSSWSSEGLFFGPMSGVPSESYLEERFARPGSNRIQTFFKELKDCPRPLSVRIFCQDGEEGFEVWKDSGSRPAPKSRIQISWEHGRESAVWRVLEVLELLKKSGVHLKQGSWERRGNNMQIDLIIVDAGGNPIPEWKVERLKEMITSSEGPPQILDPSTEYRISSVVVAGPDTFGILREITAKLASREFNIVATTLRTQDKWFASIFYVNSCHRRRLRQREELQQVQNELETENERMMVEIFFQEEVLVSEMWLNWEFSQEATDSPTMPALPDNVFVRVAPPEAGTVNVQITSQDDGYTVFDTLCTVQFNGYSIIDGSFNVSTPANNVANRQVEQSYQLNLDSPFSTSADIFRHLALAFRRRQTQGTRFAIRSADKPGQLHNWASIFHDGWWEVNRADVEVVEQLAKTMVYASPMQSRMTSAMLKRKLEEKGFRVSVSD